MNQAHDQKKGRASGPTFQKSHWQSCEKFLGAAAVIGTALIISSCTNGLKQDPYADQPESVRNAAPMDSKVKAPTGTAIKSDYLMIQADDNFEYQEGKLTKSFIKGAVTANIDGHVPVLGIDFELAINNLAEFPGATFEPSTGEFVWTPPVGFVDKTFTRNIHLNVTLTTKGSVVLETTKNIIGVVTRAEVDPIIVSVEDLTTTPTPEGATREFKVVVRDPHADPGSANTKPRLSIISSDSASLGTSGSAANLIYCKGNAGCTDPAVDPADPKQFIFTLVLDLEDKEVTKNQTTLQFGLIATSRFGEPSPLKKTNVSIVSSVNDAEMSWSDTDPIDVVAGQENTINFSVYDPKAEGLLTVNFDSRCDLVLGANAVCTCKALSSQGAQQCLIRWKVPSTTTQSDYKISISSFNQSRYSTAVKKTTFSPRTLHVVRPAAPQPAPVPPHPLKIRASLAPTGHP